MKQSTIKKIKNDIEVINNQLREKSLSENSINELLYNRQNLLTQLNEPISAGPYVCGFNAPLPVAFGGTGSTTNSGSLAGVLPVINGGTGLSSIYFNGVLIGNNSSTPTIQTIIGNVVDTNSIQSVANKIIDGNCNTLTNIILSSNANRTISAGNISKQNTTCQDTTLLGDSAGLSLINGNYNTLIGSGSGQSIQDGNNNVSIGYNAAQNGSSGNDNISIGVTAAQNSNANNNIAIGTAALLQNATDNNIAVGNFALTTNSTGERNMAIGINALRQLIAYSDNIVIGVNSLQNLINSGSNVTLGNNCLVDNTYSFQNIVIGQNNSSVSAQCGNNITIGHEHTSLINNGEIIIGNKTSTDKAGIKIGHNVNTGTNVSGVFIGHDINPVDNTIILGSRSNTIIIPSETANINKQFAGINTTNNNPVLTVSETVALGTPLTNFSSQLIASNISSAPAATFSIPPGTVFFPLSIVAYVTGPIMHSITIITSADNVSFTITNGVSDITGQITLDVSITNNVIKQTISDGQLVAITDNIVVNVDIPSNAASSFRVCIQGTLQQL
jgi:hypothetical protein